MRALCAACALAPALALAQDSGVVGVDLQKLANAVLAVMGFTVTPDVTTGSLSIFNQATGNPDFKQGSVGGGFTISKSFPLYLEGTAAYARYDPTFVVSEPPGRRAGFGELGERLGERRNRLGLSPSPPPDGRCGRSSTSRSGASRAAAWTARFLAARAAPSPSSCADGELNAFGLGGSIMLDYERYRPENEIDLELRYSNIYLQSFDSSAAVEGHASAQSVSLWSRWRAPTGMHRLERPLRYVLEYAYTRFLGDLEGTLGFEDIHSFGIGLELDSSKHDILVTRTRLLARYKVGNNVDGWAIGLGGSGSR